MFSGLLLIAGRYNRSSPNVVQVILGPPSLPSTCRFFHGIVGPSDAAAARYCCHSFPPAGWPSPQHFIFLGLGLAAALSLSLSSHGFLCLPSSVSDLRTRNPHAILLRQMKLHVVPLIEQSRTRPTRTASWWCRISAATACRCFAGCLTAMGERAICAPTSSLKRFLRSGQDGLEWVIPSLPSILVLPP